MIDFISITTALAKYGFRYFFDVQFCQEFCLYKGTLDSKRYGKVAVILFFNKRRFEFPKAEVAPESQHIIKPFHAPHIGNGWDICYHDNSVIFDLDNINDSIEFVVTQIFEVLNRYEEDDMCEILPEWKNYWYVEKTYYKHLNSLSEYYKKNGFFLEETKDFNDSIRFIKIPFIPTIKGCNWPIECYKDLEKWISNEKISKIIKDRIYYCLKFKRKVIPFIIYSEYEKLSFGIEFIFKDPILNSAVNRLKQNVIKIIFDKHTVTRFWVEGFDNNKLLNSNITPDFPNLQSKRIALVGAGTVGSNLANVLIRIGAGNDKENPLTIIDNDEYKPENYTRHILPISYFGYNKADALRKDLLNQNTSLYIETFSDSAYNYIFERYNIVIDTTGEETLTAYLNYVIRRIPYDIVSLITWVQADGKAVCCLIIPTKNCACHECFRRSEYNISIPYENYLPRRNSCSDVYVPFPVTLSQYAALLATKALLDYLEGKLTETIFYKQDMDTGKITKTVIEKNKDCKICG